MTATAQLTPNRKSYQLSKPEIEFHVMEETYVALYMRMRNEDELKNKEDLHIAGMHTALDIFRFAVFFLNFPNVFAELSFLFILLVFKRFFVVGFS